LRSLLKPPWRRFGGDDSAVDTGAKLKFTNARLRFEAQNKLDMFNFAGPIPGGTVS